MPVWFKPGCRARELGRVAFVLVAVSATIATVAPAATPASPRPAGTASDSSQPLLRLGASGPVVRALQRNLARLGYLPSTGVDGRFGMQTWQAVVALQGWSRLPRDGVVGPRTARALARGTRPVPWSTARGMEIHIEQQVLLLVGGGRVQRAIHVSTGANGATPLGHFRIYRRDTMSWSIPFHVWMPLAQYFNGGYALHEFASVPAYPASHGCVRVPVSDAQAVWEFGSLGLRVWTRA